MSHTTVPAWRQPTEGESRLAAGSAIVVVIAFQWLLPGKLLPQPAWILPLLEAACLVILMIANPSRLSRAEPWVRGLSLVLAGVITIATIVSTVRLIDTIVAGTADKSASVLLGSGAMIWATNVLAFSLWYWEFDRGGPAARANGIEPEPDFLFPQMQDPQNKLVSKDWRPEYFDYLYLSFTNAASFAPADVLPLSRWCKMMMMAQAIISLALTAMVISRAINILK
ncbi:DUF1345 domain-containing protein [Nocardia camponoti]|uniref:DUF1345 domain-containing protein n=1 Tax=Nocardia camponoti TaxID=1616106 RepID=A0A917QMJ7_9NOCA|nr:DUF1345 domain-containing protein [Nocardia camponoti]GGK58275.1 hypothetical protein GCM10011591_33120 [Nocardia camponoti]